MRKRTGDKRIFRLLTALLCAVVLLSADAAPTLALVTQEDINKLKDDAGDLDEQKKAIEARLKELKGDKSRVLERKGLLDDQIANTEARISNTEQQIAEYSTLISQSEAELNQAEADEEKQYTLFCKQVRAMEEAGTVDYWSVLFGATDFNDLLSRLDAVNEVMDASWSVIDTLRAMQEDISARKADLEGSKAASEEARAELVTRKQELNDQRAEALALVAEINNNEDEYQESLAELKAEEARIEKEIKRLQAELEAQMAAAGNNYNTNPGGYIWPTDSRYITSTVGGRSSPGGVGSTNHKGTDIGRVGYTSSVYAAKAGTVLVSQRSSSYGNYIVISHGTGNTTLYAHMSSRKVKVGDFVQQGQVIGITGSTGNSTGPHLHLEIVENGVRINPLNHGAEPKKNYLTGYTLSGSAVSR